MPADHGSMRRNPSCTEASPGARISRADPFALLGPLTRPSPIVWL